MASNFFIARTSGKILLSTNVEETLLQLSAASNIGVRILECYTCIYGTDTSGSKWQVQFVRQSTDIGGTSVTLVKDEKDISDTLQCTVDEGPFGSDGEQNVVDEVLEEWGLHVQDGLIYPMTITNPNGRICRGGDKVAILIPDPLDALNVSAYIKAEE